MKKSVWEIWFTNEKRHRV